MTSDRLPRRPPRPHDRSGRPPPAGPGARPGLAARRAALQAIVAVEDGGAYSTLAVPEAVAALDDPRDRALASNLAYQTLRWRDTLDWAIAAAADRGPDRIERWLLPILRLGAVQLLKTDVPARAAVSLSVELAREGAPAANAEGAAGFVNGVLRSLDRRRNRLRWPDPTGDVTGLALATAHPGWVVADLVAELGLTRAAAVLHADNQAPGVTLRAVGDRATLIAELRAAGIDAGPGELAPEAVRAPGADPRRLAAVAEGRALPQDEASMVVVHASRVTGGQRVLDLCAGPGGKATHLAHLVGARGAVTAVELHPGRARLIEQAARRLRVRVDVRVGDGTCLDDAPAGTTAVSPPLPADLTFDVALVDAPCTGFGTGRRRPEIRWRRTPHDQHALAGLQQRLLAAAARRVRPGGHLTYAVCTWTPTETVQVARAFKDGPSGVDYTQVEERQLLPDRDDTDGMYYATFRRSG